MHSIEFDKSIIKEVKLINVETIITHEEIIEQKADKLIKYIESYVAVNRLLLLMAITGILL